MASPERRQEQLPAEVLGLGLVVREVGIDELLGVGQERSLTVANAVRTYRQATGLPIAAALGSGP